MTRKKKRRPRSAAPRPSTPPRTQLDQERSPLLEWFFTPHPIERLEILRILLPLCILGFMSSRLLHASHWVGDAGFQVPDIGGDFRQPLYLPSLPGWMPWILAALMVASGLSMAAGFLSRYAAGLFFLTLAWVALADRLSAFTVSKLGSVLVLALALSPSGTRFGVDSWLRNRRSAPAQTLPTHVPGPVLRIFQLTLVVMYCSSGVCKARNDWLTTPYLLWTHLHGSYQTAAAHLAANLFPPWSWNVLQGITLVFEMFAPLWFYLQKTRPLALAWGLAMHAMIGLMFGPVIWFSLLMSTLLLGCFGPLRWLEAVLRRLP